MDRIYFDNSATTPLDPLVLDAMKPYFSEKFGNPSSLHSFGQDAREAVEIARKSIANRLNASAREIIFTSGGTEANNLALKGAAYAQRGKGRHIITCRIEHSSILGPCEWLSKEGFEVTYVGVDREGLVDPAKVAAAIRADTILITIGHANNEVGTVQNIAEIGKIARGKGIYFHTDACQSFTKEMMDVKAMSLDLVSINAHKIGGPKGVGALYVRGGVKIAPQEHGGPHEFRMRGGTENVPGIVGFAKAAELVGEAQISLMRSIRDALIEGILAVEKTHLNGSPHSRLCNNANFRFDGVEGESLLLRLDARGIAGSTGSACSSQSLEPSHVLLGLGLKPEECHGSLRLSAGKENTLEEAKAAVEAVGSEVGNLEKHQPHMEEMNMYSKEVMDHFMNPRNVGEITNPDAVGQAGNMRCGDMMWVYLRVEKGEGVERIADIKFKTLGCAAAIATSSKATELAKGKTLEQAIAISNADIAGSLGGLPPVKMHCSVLASDAIKEAVYSYLKANGMAISQELETDHRRISADREAAEGHCHV